MFRKALLLSLVSLSFTFSAAKKTCFAVTASDLSQAESYVRSGQFGKAEQQCISAAKNNSNSDSALKVKGKLAASHIMIQKMAQADAEVDELMKDYKGKAELPAVLYGMVLRYKAAGELQRAQNLSQRICQEFASSEQAQRIQLDSGKEQVLKHISNGKYRQAEEAVNSMVAAAGNSPAMPTTLYRIAKEFKEYEKYDEADRVYARIAQGYPSSKFGVKAKMAVDKLKIWNLIKEGNVTGVQAAMEKLVKEYKGEEDLAHTLHGFGIQFEKGGNFEQAKAIYQKVKNDFPDDWVAEIATVDLEMCDVRAMIGKAKFSDVLSQLNTVRNKFAGHWHLPKAVRQVGQEYQRQAMKLEVAGSGEQAKKFYRNAIAVWDIVVNNMPVSLSTAPACCWSGDCYCRLGEYAKARDCYQRVLDNYPAYKFAWHVLFMVGQSYEGLKESEAVSQSEADTKIKAVYQQLLEKYPDCSAAEPAKAWLDCHNSN